MEVYFDDLTLRHIKSPVLQHNACPPQLQRRREYYPFGLQTANSWTRENTTTNNYLANGGTLVRRSFSEGGELNQTSQLYDLEFRNYDPVLGRMFQVDPVAAKYASLTPYNYSFNNPMGFTDPSGADPDPDYQNPNHQYYFHNGAGVYGRPGLTYDDYDPMTRLANGDSKLVGSFLPTCRSSTRHVEVDLQSMSGQSTLRVGDSKPTRPMWRATRGGNITPSGSRQPTVGQLRIQPSTTT